MAQSIRIHSRKNARKITVVVPTHDRYDRLVTLLKSIREHWAQEIDSVVVVDDSLDPVDLSDEFGDIGLRHLILKRRVFITRAKNIGWKAASTDYIYFIDDDNVIGASTIPPIFDAIVRNTDMGAIMPAVLYKSKPDLVWVYATPLVKDHFKMNLIGRNIPRDSNLENRMLKTDALPNASLVRRKALEDVGGFNEALVINSSMDLALRLKSKGWKVVAFTGAFILHDVEPPGRIGWWATHGALDHQRVQYEIRDWIMLRRQLKPRERLFVVRTLLESSQFVAPNLLAYVFRGKSRRNLVRSLLIGCIQGLTD